MKLIKSTIQNIGAVDFQSFTFDGKTAIIMGANGSGKSTMIEALSNYLRGSNKAKLLRDGSDSGLAEYEMSNGDIIKLEIKKGKKGKATLISADGKKEPLTKKLANELFPPKLDLNKFMHLSPAARVATLKETLGIDTTAVDKKIKDLENKRQDVGREAKTLQALGDQYDESIDSSPQSASDILDELQAAKEYNNSITKVESSVSEQRNNTKIIEEKIKRLQSEIEEANLELSHALSHIEEGENWLAANTPIEDDRISELQDSLYNVEKTNEKIVQNNQFKVSLRSAEAKQGEYDAFSSQIDELRKKRLEVFKEANIPENIKIEGDNIIIDGLPLVQNQLSHALIDISALKLARTMMGTAKWLTFDASALDRKNIKSIIDWAKQEDIQLLIEIPSRGREEDDMLHLEVIE